MTVRCNAFGQPIGEPLPDWTPRLWPPRTPLEGRFCRLEPLDAGRHTDALHAAYAQALDARDWTYLPDERESDLTAFRAFIVARAESVDPLHMAIVRDREALGTAALMRIDPANGTIELGQIHFSPALQRTVAATESLFLLMRRAFDELGYRRLEWKCDSLNAPSRRAASRRGLSFEGVFRGAAVTKGRNRDTAWYAIRSHDWPIVRNGFDQWLASRNFDDDGRQTASLASFRAGGA